LLDVDGDVYPLGDAVSYGDWPAGAGPPLGGAAGIAPTHDGHGYWIVDAFGDVANLGDAPPIGAPQALTAVVSGIVTTPDGGGYWIFGVDGSVYPFGDAVSYGGTQNLP